MGGFKCGIEIHQRLGSAHKLFCSCANRSGADDLDGSVERKMRIVAGELGEIDPAAIHEFKRDRTFVYQIYKNEDCLVEMDEEPPHALNPEAIDIALEVCLLLGATAVDEIHVMRKIVIDGSNTGGFQRTAIIGLDGKLETSKGLVRIPTICLEEESAGIVEANEKTVYRLDRLGMPLVEIATAPDVKDAAHAREVAEKLGELLRATGKVQRGIGTIRQDVNVSIEGGARIEIKGAQALEDIQKLVENEAARQKKLIEIIGEMRKRRIKKEKGEPKIADVTRAFSKTESKIIKKVVEGGGKVLAVLLPNFSGLLGKELYGGRRFGTEVSDYAKPAGVRGLIHSDENLKKYDISENEIKAIRDVLHAKENDAFILVAATEETARKALTLAFERAHLEVVPEETRRAIAGGGSEYMRPLPGSARLYPETDVPPVALAKERIERIRASLPEKPDEKRKKLESALGGELREKIIRSKNLRLFEKVVEELGVDATLVASTLEETLVSLRRAGVEVEKIGEEKIYELFGEYSKNKFV
ncbi:MAG: Glu-tRNA(Gln) amidotransferase subunit GatE, partial [Candidatus Micrarchaeota archaeon]